MSAGPEEPPIPRRDLLKGRFPPLTDSGSGRDVLYPPLPDTRQSASKLPESRNTTPPPPTRPAQQPQRKDYNQQYKEPSGTDHVRRKLLKYMGVGAAAVAVDSALSHVPASLIDRLGFTRSVWEQIETGTFGQSAEVLRSAIERSFGVRFVGPRTGVSEIPVPKDLDARLDVPENRKLKQTADWDAPQLIAIANVLSELDERFYKPAANDGRKLWLEFVLVETPAVLRQLGLAENYMMHSVLRLSDSSKPVLRIVFDKAGLGQTPLDRQQTREDIVHELTHVVTGEDIETYKDAITKPLGLRMRADLLKAFASEVTVEKDYYKDQTGELFVVKQLFDKEKFPEQSKNMSGEPVKVNDQVYIDSDLYKLKGEAWVKQLLANDPKIKNGISKNDIYWIHVNSILKVVEQKSIIGYGATNFNEFFSVAAQYYIQGKDKFIASYKPHLGEKKAIELYENTKTAIFKGKEYNPK